jgi:hypothetical protein
MYGALGTGSVVISLAAETIPVVGTTATSIEVSGVQTPLIAVADDQFWLLWDHRVHSLVRRLRIQLWRLPPGSSSCCCGSCGQAAQERGQLHRQCGILSGGGFRYAESRREGRETRTEDCSGIFSSLISGAALSPVSPMCIWSSGLRGKIEQLPDAG